MDLAFDERRQLELRDEIARLTSSAEVEPPFDGVDVVVSHVEVCDSHGTGLLTKQIFGGSAGLVSVRSHDQYGGRQDFGDRALRLAHGSASPTAVLVNVMSIFHGSDVRRVVSIPYFPDDVTTTLALKDLYAAPLCTFVMDDNNVEADGIPDAHMRELLARSELRLAISPELRDAYERKFGLRFWLVPPLVSPRLVRPDPEVPPADVLAARRGVVVGNIWGDDWLEQLRATVRGTGIELDWFCNSGRRWLTVADAELGADGIRVRGAVPEDELLLSLRRAAYVVVPSGTLGARDTRRAIARLSLPSRIPYVLATSQAPILVLGHPATAAARFVTAHGVGLSAPYDRARFVAAVAEVTAPAAQAAMRARAAELGPLFSSDGARDWIWRSLDAGRPVDTRWERLVSERKHAC